mgnify:CR=1 FL=1
MVCGLQCWADAGMKVRSSTHLTQDKIQTTGLKILKVDTLISIAYSVNPRLIRQQVAKLFALIGEIHKINLGGIIELV